MPGGVRGRRRKEESRSYVVGLSSTRFTLELSFAAAVASVCFSQNPRRYPEMWFLLKVLVFYTTFSQELFLVFKPQEYEFLAFLYSKIVAVCMFTRWVDIKTITIRNDCFGNSARASLSLVLLL